MNPILPSFKNPIVWDFTIAEQLNVSRYGHSGADYFKQFLPFGIEVSTMHPPQRILQRTYEMAKRLAAKPLTPPTP